MSDTKQRLDEAKKAIQEKDFLEGKGLSNEVNIRIFCYKPEEEMMIRHFANQLKKEKLNCNVIEYDLYEVFLDICKDKRILDKIPALEEKKGRDFLAKQFEKMCDAKTFAAKMQYEPQNPGKDIVVLTGIGKVFPFMRVHSLLEAMQPLFTDVPILVFYPGSFDGHYVKLFNKLKPNEYYRAFSSL